MAMIQNQNEVHFTGMTRVQLEGNKIIASQNGEAQVTIAANTRSLTELADKIGETTAKKNILTDQQMLDLAVMEKYNGRCGHYTYDHKDTSWFPYRGDKMSMIEFIEFYLSANRLGYNPHQMREILCIPSNPQSGKVYSRSENIMNVTYLEARIRQAEKYAKQKGFELPPLKNPITKSRSPIFESKKLEALNWAG